MSNTKEEQQFKDTVSAMIFAQLFLDNMDKVELAPMYKQRVKLRGKAFTAELDAFMDAAYGSTGETERSMIDLMDKCQKTVEKILDEDMVMVD